MNRKPEIATAFRDPASMYADPGAVVTDRSLSREQKIRILRRWEYDAREMQVAEEEGLAPSGPEPLLDAVLAALNALGAVHDVEHSPPTKQGGD